MFIQEFSSKNANFSIDYVKGFRNPKTPSKLHHHAYHELSIIESGNITYNTTAAVSKAVDRCVLFSKAHELHNPVVDCSHLYERFQVKFDSNFIERTVVDTTPFQDILQHSYIKQVNQKDFLELSATVKRLYRLIQNNTVNDIQKLEESMLLISLILKSYTALPINEFCENNYITDVIEFIKKNFDNHLTIEIIAANFLISKSKLIYDFKAYCHMNILEYITMTRINAAREYLLRGYSVSFVAEKCGFSSASYFIKVFSSVTNMTPLKFQIEYSLTDSIPSF